MFHHCQKCGWNCYVTRAFSGFPMKGNKMKSGYITPAFLGAHKWAEVPPNPCILGGPHKREQNQKCLHHPCLLGGPRLAAGGRSPFTLANPSPKVGGGGFGCMKTLLLHKNLAVEKTGGVMQKPPCCRFPQMHPPPPSWCALVYMSLDTFLCSPIQARLADLRLVFGPSLTASLLPRLIAGINWYYE